MIPVNVEVNFDGLVGPTHNYSGLSYGNIASTENKNTESNPKAAALQGLEKMKFLYDLGLYQGVIPPHERPHIPTLRSLGFTGKDNAIPEKVYQVSPSILSLYSSASPMWVANAATFTPSIDSYDNKVHITTANLTSTCHRSIEAKDTSRILEKIFPSHAFFTHHPPLPHCQIFTDEGEANHTRFCREHSEMGLHLFVWGTSVYKKWAPGPKKYPARQTLEASEAVARAHHIYPERVIFAEQSPDAIDAGAFHNDVISVGGKNIFFYHEKAFINTPDLIQKLQERYEEHCDASLQLIEVKESEVPLKTSIETYLFNSQLIHLSDQTVALFAPQECHDNNTVNTYLENLMHHTGNPLQEVHFINLNQSMRNGGGPACLSTRVVLSENELEATNPKCLFNERLYKRLTTWIEKHYRDRLTPTDFRDPNLVDEGRAALHELTEILDLGSIYSFQS